MGVDIYSEWRGISEKERKNQGGGVFSGNTGYLRESYNGQPYPSLYLLKEVFESDDNKAQIPAKLLRKRLKHTLSLASMRNLTLYDGEDQEKTLKSYADFVKLCEEKEKETGEPVTIIASY